MVLEYCTLIHNPNITMADVLGNPQLEVMRQKLKCDIISSTHRDREITSLVSHIRYVYIHQKGI